jgi:rare lipoprotein A
VQTSAAAFSAPGGGQRPEPAHQVTAGKGTEESQLLLLLRRSTLWIGCGLLTLAYAAAENLTGEFFDADPQPAIALEDFVAELPAAEGAGLTQEASAWAEGASVLVVPLPRGSACWSPSEPRKLRRVCRVTAYCDRGLTAAGTRAGVGQCAAPEDIPFGTRVYIPALKRSFIVTDRTHPRFRRNTVDIFLPSESICQKFGQRYLECEFILPDKAPSYGRLLLSAGR